MKISIFWTWYVGLVSWACLAELGHDVLCIDIDEKKIQKLKDGIIPIFEPWLEDIVTRNFESERLTFSTDIEEWVNFWKVIFSAVGTPPDKNNHNKADLRFVYEVAKTFWKNIKEYKVFVNKSTVPVWTGKECYEIIKREIYERQLNIDFDVVSNPEFLREGNAVKDFLLPDRVVIWSQSEKARLLMEDVYKPLKKNSTELGFTQIIHTDICSAEVIKYASNAFLATKISFINEVANFCELSGADIESVALWVWSDRRIWKTFLNAGVWYGGSCFPKDLQALVETWKEFGFDFSIISSVHEVNEKQKKMFFEKLKNKIGDFTWKKIWIWGISFKPNTDDIRSAPSLSMIEELLKTEVEEIRVYDPVAMENLKTVFSDTRIYYSQSSLDATQDISALVLLTEWDEFKTPNLRQIRKNMKEYVILDGRNLWDAQEIIDAWFEYQCIGKKINS